MSAITTHVLDVSRGKPARGIVVVLERAGSPESAVLARGTTDADGRVKAFSPAPTLQAGVHRLTFDVGAYFAANGVEAFYPRVIVEFELRDAVQHYHVPLLLSPFGYSTYRGS
jgi:5-hydroxyisourate hydrolase